MELRHRDGIELHLVDDNDYINNNVQRHDYFNHVNNNSDHNHPRA